MIDEKKTEAKGQLFQSFIQGLPLPLEEKGMEN